MRVLLLVGLLAVGACSSGSEDAATTTTGTASDDDPATVAIARVRANWQACLTLAGTTVEGATAEPTPDELRVPVDADGVSMLVTLRTGEQFIVVVGGRLKGARVANTKADATLDRALVKDPDC